MADTDSPRAGDTSRATNVLYLMPPDAGRLAQLVLPSLASGADAKSGTLRTLVLTEDEDTAVAVARIASREIGGGLAPIVALTAPARAKRLLQSSVPGAVVMPTRVAAALIAQSSLPLTGVRHIVVTMAPPGDAGAFATVIGGILSEIPKTATRTLVAARETPELEQLVESHFFKARKVRDAAASVSPGTVGRIQVLPATSGTRWDALRRLIDQIDPPAAAVLATNAATFSEAQHELAALGYSAEGPVVVTRETPEQGTHLVVLAGSPDAESIQKAMAAAPVHLVVLCAPSEIANVRAVAGSISVQAVTLDGPRARAATRDAATRARLREILASGEFARELAAITPLLDEYDGSEVAAAALVMAAEATRQPPAIAAAPAAPPASAPTPRERPPAPRGRPREEGRGPPRDGYRGPPREGHRGPPRDDRRGPREEWRGAGRDERRGPRDERSGPPRDDRRGPPRKDSRGPSRNDDPRKTPRSYDERKPRAR